MVDWKQEPGAEVYTSGDGPTPVIWGLTSHGGNTTTDDDSLLEK